MGFDEFTKKHAARLASNASASGTPQIIEEEEGETGTVTNFVGKNAAAIMAAAAASLNKLGLDARLTSGQPITELSGRYKVSVAGTTVSIFDLAFDVPPKDLGDGISFSGRVAIIVIMPPGALRLEIHGSDISVGAHPARYVKLASLLPQALSDELFEAAIKSAIERYIGQ